MAARGNANNTDFNFRDIPLPVDDVETAEKLKLRVGGEAPAGKLFFFGKVADNLEEIGNVGGMELKLQGGSGVSSSLKCASLDVDVYIHTFW